MENVLFQARLKAAAGTAEIVTFCPPSTVSGQKYRLKSAPRLIHNAALATNGTDYVTVQAYKGASTALCTARVTSATGFTQYGTDDLALAVGGTDLEIDSTSVFSVRVAHSGSGKNIDSMVVAEFEVVR